MFQESHFWIGSEWGSLVSLEWKCNWSLSWCINYCINSITHGTSGIVFLTGLLLNDLALPLWLFFIILIFKLKTSSPPYVQDYSSTLGLSSLPLFGKVFDCQVLMRPLSFVHNHLIFNQLWLSSCDTPKSSSIV